MTREKAIEQLSGAEVMLFNREFKPFQEAIIMAISALRGQESLAEKTSDNKASDKKQATSEWISVEERLPENSANVLVCHENGYVTTNAWLIGCWWFKNERNPITHWMPLPEPPKEE